MTFYGASVIGRGHRREGRGGQDAWAGRALEVAVTRSTGWAIAVADGCSGGRANEIGAGVGARAALISVARRVRAGVGISALPALVVADVVEELGRLARALSLDADEAPRIIEEALLATLHVAVVVAGECVAFGVGDGVVCIDGERDAALERNRDSGLRVVALDQGPAPDYPAYALFSGIAAPRVLTHYEGRAPRALALCSDGALELIARAHEPLADGAPVGGVEWFVRDERCVRNASLAQKRMQAWVDATGGPVDDCTVVVVRP